MRVKLTGICLFLIVFSSLIFLQTDSHARKRLLDGRSEGMASIEVTASSADEVARAVKHVFNGDGYNLKEEWDGQLQFSRSAGRMKDLSYGGLAGSGTYEQVMIDIQDNGGGNYKIECNVYMTEGDSDPDFMDTKVLKAFGREYKRMLRKVKRQIN